jgi:hypothetical protein
MLWIKGKLCPPRRTPTFALLPPARLARIDRAEQALLLHLCPSIAHVAVFLYRRSEERDIAGAGS